MLLYNTPTSDLKLFISKRFGKMLTTRDINNLRSRIKPRLLHDLESAVSQIDVQGITKVVKTGGFITHLCFLRYEERMLFQKFPHVVNVDATHGTNRQNPDTQSVRNDDSLCVVSDESCATECSLLSEVEKADNTKGFSHTPSSDFQVSRCATPQKIVQELNQNLSPSVVELLHPSKKRNTRESEEVRIIKLYKHALSLCSSGSSEDKLTAKPLLESIVRSFLLKSQGLPTRLRSIKYATSKLLGEICMRHGENSRAFKLLLKALQLDQSDICLWLNLFRVSVDLGRFSAAYSALDHVLSERPTHPIALPRSLTFHLAVANLELCVDLSIRSLLIDPLDERAVYCIQHAVKLQPNLEEALEDILRYSPDLLHESISEEIREQLDREVEKIRTVYLNQLDALADSRKIQHVDFHRTMHELSWPELLELTVEMFDDLQSKSILNSVLNISSLVSTEQREKLLTAKSTQLVPQSTDPVQSIDVTIPTSVQTSEFFLADNAQGKTDRPIEQSLPGNPSEVQSESLGLLDPSSSASTQNKPSENNAEEPETGASDVCEKRRSSRARPNVDLTDGSSRYRSKRGPSAEVGEGGKRSIPKRSKRDEGKAQTLQRSRLLQALNGLLPKVIRDIAEVAHSADDKQTSDRLVSTNETNPSDAPKPVEDSKISTPIDPFTSPDVVLKFIEILEATQPNIITFGIALLLQTSQLTNTQWSHRMCSSFVSLFDRLRTSFPHAYHSPAHYIQPVDQEYIFDECTGLLPNPVLELRAWPTLVQVTRLFLTYVELRLEQLESKVDTVKWYPVQCEGERDTRSSSQELFVNQDTVFTLLDAFSTYDMMSPNFVQIQAHYTWINYLLSSLIKDYPEMQSQLFVLNKLLTENGVSIKRNYSVHHGYLTSDYIQVLLGQLSGLTDLETLTQLAKDDQHLDVVRTMVSKLKSQRSICSQSKGQEAFNRNFPLHLCEQLNLLTSSIRSLIDNFQDATTTGSKSSSGDTDPRGSMLETAHQCYIACVLLLDCISNYLGRKETSEETSNMPSVDSLNAIGSDAMTMLLDCWDLLTGDPAHQPMTTVNSTVDATIQSASQLPLRLVLYDDTASDVDDDEVPETQRTSNHFLSVGDASHAVSTVLRFLTWRLKAGGTTATTTTSFQLSRGIVTFIFEHLLCLQHSIPSDLLPMELRMVSDPSRTLTDVLSMEQKSDLLSGSISAPPVLVWLNWVHEWWNISKDSNCSTLCRDRPEILSILRQTLTKTAKLLQSISTDWACELDQVLAYRQQLDTPPETSTEESYHSTQSQDEFVETFPNDDDTVACVDDLSPIGAQYWPCGAISLSRLLAQCIRCLLPASVFAAVDDKSLSIDSPVVSKTAEAMECETSSQSVRSDVPRQRRSRVAPSETRLLWMREVSKHLCDPDLADHSTALSNVNQLAWWTVQRPNGPTEHHAVSIDWECMEIVFSFCCPQNLPEYDSVKTLSVSPELLNLLIETIKLIPAEEQAQLLPMADVEKMMQRKPEGSLDLLSGSMELSNLTRNIFYVIADHYMKNNSFELAVEYYMKDLRAYPTRSDSWAALSLISYSNLEEILNLTSLRTERVTPEAVARCLRCFTVALSLLSNPVTLLIERGCMAYQLHSYSARWVKKSAERSIAEGHLELCRKWRHQMLQLTRSSYEQVLNYSAPIALTRVTNQSFLEFPTKDNSLLNEPPTPGMESEDFNKRMEQAAEETWLCHYMLAKCSEKEAGLLVQQQNGTRGIAQHLMPILNVYWLALEALDAAGAKYPRKIIVYHKLPFRSVEAIEVFYRIHALALKTLLHYGPPSTAESDENTTISDQLPLTDLLNFLRGMQTCEFVASAGKSRRSKKRSAAAAGLSTKMLAPPAKSRCETQTTMEPCAVPDEKPTPAGDQIELDKVLGAPSQEEFVDLTSPEPAAGSDDSSPPTDETSQTKDDPSTLWQQCVNLCRIALELVLQRLPLHYKAMYRLADLYRRAPHLKDLSKALTIMLGPLNESAKGTSHLGGLFKDRKQHNFFHGVWRIPTSDIDRSGNFAAHMYRSVHLTLDLLHQTGDWRHLVHIFHQLRKQPPEDKRGFLGESDRVYLAKRAFNLIRPTLMMWLSQLYQSISSSLVDLLANSSNTQSTLAVGFINAETLTQIYRLHCVAYSRSCTTPAPTGESPKSPASEPNACTAEAAVTSGYADVLQLAHRLCPMVWDSRGPDLSLTELLQKCAEITSASRSSLPVQTKSPARTDAAKSTAASTSARTSS